MKLPNPTCRSSHSAERGSAVLVILVMLSIMVTFAIANSRTTHHLQRELQLIEKRQLKRHESAAVNHAALGAQEAETLLADAEPSATPPKREVAQSSIYPVGNELALTLTLSPQEREPPLAALEKSLASERLAGARESFSLSLGERAEVRASVLRN